MTDRCRGRGLKENEGSMVVEAAMVMPFFLLFVIFLIFIVQMTLFSTALQGTVSDTVKEVASHMYPAALAVQQLEETSDSGAASGSGNTESGAGSASGAPDTGESSSKGWTIPRISVEEWADRFALELPSPLDNWVKSAAHSGEGPLQELQAEASEAVQDSAVKPLLKPYLSSGILDYNRIHVSNVTIPKLDGKSEPYFGIEVSYELPMKVPFIGRSIVLEASAVERAWIGETENGQEGGDGEGEEAGSISILEKPNPAIPWHKGTIRIRVKPNESVNLTIYYQSGRSTAKFLGWKQADEDGYITWEWTVGGRTTPGSTPTFVIETEDGRRAEGQFNVAANN